MSHVVVQFYGVYLLQSEPKPRSFYIGSSPDIARRLRQHNGDLKAGGAYRTKRSGLRPWRMLCVVYGFPSKVSALQFEHAFQHPHLSRHLRDSKKTADFKVNGISIHHRLAAIRLLVSCTYFDRLRLRVCIFDSDTLEVQWAANKFNVAPDVQAHYAHFSDFVASKGLDSYNVDHHSDLCALQSGDRSDNNLPTTDRSLYDGCDKEVGSPGSQHNISEPQQKLKNITRDTGTTAPIPSQGDARTLGQSQQTTSWLDLAKSRILKTLLTCSHCYETIDFFPEDSLDGSQDFPPLAFLCRQCPATSHLTCMAQPITDSVDLLPSTAACRQCGLVYDWVLVARIATMLRSYVLKTV